MRRFVFKRRRSVRDSSNQSDISSLRCEVNSRGDGGLGGGAERPVEGNELAGEKR